MTQKERIQKFLELKQKAVLLEAEMREIKNYFDSNLDVITETLKIPDSVFIIPVSVTHAGKVCRKSRTIKKCNMENLKENFPETFETCVSDSTINYIKIRKVVRR